VSRTADAPVTDADEEEGLLRRFLDACRFADGLADNTVASYAFDLRGCARVLQARGRRLSTARAEDLLDGLAALQALGRAPRTVSRLMSALRRYYRFLVADGVRRDDPTLVLARPRLGRPLPRTLSERDVVTLLEAPETGAPLGLRDRALFEILYACGLRVSELIALRTAAYGARQGVLRVRGKGRKERIVPVGEEARRWLERYLVSARPLLLGVRESPWLFVNARGGPLTRQGVWTILRGHARRVGLESRVSPHVFRHAFATHLVDHGADLRAVQLLLGHSDLGTTEIYTHVARERLQTLHRRHHPRG
jgi:integrase/recombinase XerD